MGILIALIPALGWGVQPVILGKIGGKPTNQILGTGVGALIVGILVQMFTSPSSLSWQAFAISMLAGMAWVLGQVGQYKVLPILGVSQTMPLTTGLQLIGTSLIGVIFFGEWSGVISKVGGFAAIALIVIGSVLTSYTEGGNRSDGLYRGLAILVPTSIGYWIYSALPKTLSASGLSMFLPEMIGVFLGAVIYVLITDPKAVKARTSWLSMIIGLTFSISALAYIYSAKANGVATAYIITQLNVVVATLGGLVVLHEHKTRRELILTLSGLVLIVAGSIVTVFL
ncbi:GRP family sugar transporter [Lentilactobacillus kosonis]|uniref:Glucose uptake protein n=1 Tax=Lentilactobacillus kosonis TaxID=2810561 RepID=A0A401FI09_9LACO|nr:GRP family sugar transporter [Lentilactobacillus kosonis]GAY71891.1 glucose uptake protein [Lentilactobacillus kosonis]